MVSGLTTLCAVHIGLVEKDYSMFCFITIYTFTLWVENTVSFFRELQISENPYSKDLGRQQSKTLRAQKKEKNGAKTYLLAPQRLC